MKKVKAAVGARIAKVEETEQEVDSLAGTMITKEERSYNEQQELCPLLTGGTLK